MSYVVRAAIPPQTLSETIRHRLRSIDPGVGIFLMRTMERVVSDSIADTRLLSRLLSLFGALASALAMVGVYGVMSWLVARRRHEIGVRIAVGAARSRLAGFVLGNAVRIAARGALLGVGLAVMMGVGLRRFVVGISVVDPMTLLGSVAGVLAVVVVASLVPAWRASRVDPVVALRDE
jgi:putative ABC transport system permease protein